MSTTNHESTNPEDFLHTWVCYRAYFLQQYKIQWKNAIGFLSRKPVVTSSLAFQKVRHACSALCDGGEWKFKVCAQTFADIKTNSTEMCLSSNTHIDVNSLHWN